jgi:ribosomal protein S18 acetylase RimI-like enzyme
MKIDAPARRDIPALQALWKEAFSDSEEFLALFFSTGFSPARCMAAWQEEELAAALYWFDCEANGQKIAYLYAIATAKRFRRQGICRALMEAVHCHLQQKGYVGALLVPETPALAQYYRRIGYCTATAISEFSACRADAPLLLRQIDAKEYAALRQAFLPLGSVLQEGENLDFLAGNTQFYSGENLLLAVQTGSNGMFVPEFLGDPACAPGVLATLGAANGTFRTPGSQKPFAMFLPLAAGVSKPQYFAFAFD